VSKAVAVGLGSGSGDLPWHEAFDFLDRLRRVVLHDLIGLAQAYMDATLARSSSSSSNSSSNKRAAQAPNASWEQQCLAGQVLPFVVGCLADRRASLSRNSVECLADVFVAAGGQHLKAAAVSDWAHTSTWLDCRDQQGRQTQLPSVLFVVLMFLLILLLFCPFRRWSRRWARCLTFWAGRPPKA
jgi:hypothetical protein